MPTAPNGDPSVQSPILPHLGMTSTRLPYEIRKRLTCFEYGVAGGEAPRATAGRRRLSESRAGYSMWYLER